MTAPFAAFGNVPERRHDPPARMWCETCERWLVGRDRAELDRVVAAHLSENDDHEVVAW